MEFGCDYKKFNWISTHNVGLLQNEKIKHIIHTDIQKHALKGKEVNLYIHILYAKNPHNRGCLEVFT